jgi:hypothetical protein
MFQPTDLPANQVHEKTHMMVKRAVDARSASERDTAQMKNNLSFIDDIPSATAEGNDRRCRPGILDYCSETSLINVFRDQLSCASITSE